MRSGATLDVGEGGLWLREVRGDSAAIVQDYLNIKPVYFNSGCCCFSDGDITGIEIADGSIRLIKWKESDQASKRIVLQEKSLKALVGEL